MISRYFMVNMLFSLSPLNRQNLFIIWILSEYQCDLYSILFDSIRFDSILFGSLLIIFVDVKHVKPVELMQNLLILQNA